MNLKKDINNIHDKSYKDLYSNKEVFLDLIKGMLNAPWAKNLKPEDLTLSNNTYIASDYEETESDIVYSATIDGNEVIFYVLLEFQSSVDYRMPLRLFFYISELLREHSKNANHKPYDKDIKIPAIIPIVLYNGKTPWDAKVRFRDIINNGALYGNNIIDFTYDVIDINNKYSKEDLLNLKSMTSAIFLLDQKIDPQEFLQRIKAIALFFNGLSEKELQALKHWIKNSVEDRLAEKAIEILNSNKEDIENMVSNNAFILTEMEKKAKAQGAEEKIRNVAIKMIKKGNSIEEIMELTELPRDIIENLIKENS